MQDAPDEPALQMQFDDYRYRSNMFFKLGILNRQVKKGKEQLRDEKENVAAAKAERRHSQHTSTKTSPLVKKI
jgi:hypothetical protein